jgi:hypothetical protein
MLISAVASDLDSRFISSSDGNMGSNVYQWKQRTWSG